MARSTDFSIEPLRAIHLHADGVHLERPRPLLPTPLLPTPLLPTPLLEASMPVLGNIIGPELLIVLAIALLLFGSTKLPKLARSLGSAKGEFERGLRDEPES
jgi:sec-independent protein translocase protein TatA